MTCPVVVSVSDPVPREDVTFPVVMGRTNLIGKPLMHR